MPAALTVPSHFCTNNFGDRTSQAAVVNLPTSDRTSVPRVLSRRSLNFPSQSSKLGEGVKNFYLLQLLLAHRHRDGDRSH
jgi:hypothetical protein